MSTVTPEQRARQLLMGDLSDLSARISRREEWLACETMLNNGCIMRHQSTDPDIYDDVPVTFYEGANNPALITPAAKWTHSADEKKPGNWYFDVIQMVKMLTLRGRAATDLVVSNDVGNFLMEDPWVLYMMDNRRADYGALNPQELTPYVTTLGRFNFGGRRLEIFVNDGTFEDMTGKDTVPGCWQCHCYRARLRKGPVRSRYPEGNGQPVAHPCWDPRAQLPGHHRAACG